ncbi:hypothetical protein IGI04_032893 [Brassica rapa subsp. trilocularis]|uniref:Malectin-like domain-containing protein n=1 Tax=Brassica rapa subsp. trilocularis TaxID=1813537 RepID=A0ABQ7L4B4_BRACM|nr:hypothetical protein IGI04_032893 [Brassica rapa subsp. trilocularis]
MGSTNLGPITIVFFFYVISMVHCINNIQELDDQIRSYAARANKGRHTGSLYELSLPANLSDVKASVVTVRNSVFWRKGANFSGVYVPPMVKTTPYAKRIAFVYETFGDHSSSVYFRLADDNYSFISPVIGFTAYDATNTNNLKRLNLSIDEDNSILIKLDPYVSHNQRRGIKCVALGDNNESLKFSNTTRNYSCATTNSRGHYALVAPNQKHNPTSKLELARRKWWWIALTIIGISVLLAAVIGVVVKLVRKKKFKEMERESEKSETVGNIWIGQSRMPAATMVRTQPCLEYHEDFPSSN